MAPPNVVVIVLDTARRDRVGCYGYDGETTPTLDAFAAGATRYADAVAQAPWSIPSHGSLFTGRYPAGHGATTIQPILRSGPTLPELLSDAGYETYAVSPNEYIRPLTGFGRGFDTFSTPGRLAVPAPIADALAPYINAITSRPRLRRPVERLFNAARVKSGPTASGREAARDGWTVDRAASVIAAASEPFFLFVNFIDLHLPPSAKPRYIERFVDDDLHDVPVVADERAFTFGGRSMDEAERRKLRQLYDASIRTLNERLGRLLAALQEAIALEDALVVLVSDHGEHLGEFGLVGHQHSVFDSVVSVPLVIQFPGRGGGRVVDGQVEIRRVFHTVLHEAGVRAYPEQTLETGRPDAIAYGEFYTPMVDVERLVWDRTVAFDPALLGERLSFVRGDGYKLIRSPDQARLFRTPERAGAPIPLEANWDRYDRLAGVTSVPAATD